MEHFNLENNKFETDELELVYDAMNNAYNIFTGKTSYESLFFEGSDRIPLPFNPFSRNLDCKEIIDLMVEYYVDREWYERCAKLVELKKKF